MKRMMILILGLTAAMATRAYADDHPALGVLMSDTIGDPTGGAVITSVAPGSPASLIGLQVGDRIMSINQQPVADFRDVTRMISTSASNSLVNLDVVRGNWRGTLSTTLSSSSQVFVSQPAPYVVYYNNPVPYYGGYGYYGYHHHHHSGCYYYHGTRYCD